jgi:hypothetical protein
MEEKKVVVLSNQQKMEVISPTSGLQITKLVGNFLGSIY